MTFQRCSDRVCFLSYYLICHRWDGVYTLGKYQSDLIDARRNYYFLTDSLVKCVAKGGSSKIYIIARRAEPEELRGEEQ